MFKILGPRNYNYSRDNGQLKLGNSDWLVIGAKDEGSEKYIRGMTVGVAICDEISLMPQSFFQMLLSQEVGQQETIKQEDILESKYCPQAENTSGSRAKNWSLLFSEKTPLRLAKRET